MYSILYEIGFIFLLNPADGKIKYITLKESGTYTSLDLDLVLTDKDVSSIKISHTPFSDLITKMIINYDKHPATDAYLSRSVFYNSTARTNYDIQTKENIKEVNLDMLTDCHGGASASDTEGNSTKVKAFWDYYSNLFGDIKIVADVVIVNPDRWNIEVGDIVVIQFDINPFGSNYVFKYWIAVDIRKTLDSVKAKLVCIQG